MHVPQNKIDPNYSILNINWLYNLIIRTMIIERYQYAFVFALWETNPIQLYICNLEFSFQNL